jgi:hypothetical protein
MFDNALDGALFIEIAVLTEMSILYVYSLLWYLTNCAEILREIILMARCRVKWEDCRRHSLSCVILCRRYSL